MLRLLYKVIRRSKPSGHYHVCVVILLHPDGAFILGDDPPCMDDAGKPPKDPESDVYPDIYVASRLEEYGQGRDEYGQKV